MATVALRRNRKGDDEYAYIRVDLAKHPWREAPSVLAVKGAAKVGGPLALSNLAIGFDQGVVDVWLGGLAADKGKVLDAAEWTFSVPTELLGDQKMAVYENGVFFADEGEKMLKWGIKVYSETLQTTKSDVAIGYRQRAVRTYWSILDSVCDLLTQEACSDDASLNQWIVTVRSAMIRSYRAECPHTTPRQIQAFALGQRKLVLRHQSGQLDAEAA